MTEWVCNKKCSLHLNACIAAVLIHSSPYIPCKASAVAKVNGKYLTLRTALSKTFDKSL